MLNGHKMTESEFLEYWESRLSKMTTFETDDDIPDIPQFGNHEKFYRDVVVSNLVRCGAIPKSELIVGKKYLGHCRNSSTATWVGDRFEYTRNKMGFPYTDSILHFEDDLISDVFIPIKQI